MNERPGVDKLREAMRNASYGELESAAVEIGRAAVAVAVAVDADVKQDGSAEAERERLLDAALGDAIEVTARHRLRLGRRVCSRPDATTTRRIFELLRAMAGPDGGADGDPSFQ